ncbi:hypothetical protein [Streptomyces kurssanovii]|uniref:Uncharacterized protein n=1 Tax=Streptomyces kurssanovii TaxID=67312 RepID=A0ABV3HXX5_9ACTN
MSEFVTGDPQLLVNTFAVEPEMTGEDVTFSYDDARRSVAFSWFSDSGEVSMRLFREGARRLRVEEEGGRTGLLTEFGTADTWVN